MEHSPTNKQQSSYHRERGSARAGRRWLVPSLHPGRPPQSYLTHYQALAPIIAPGQLSGDNPLSVNTKPQTLTLFIHASFVPPFHKLKYKIWFISQLTADRARWKRSKTSKKNGYYTALHRWFFSVKLVLHNITFLSVIVRFRCVTMSWCWPVWTENHKKNGQRLLTIHNTHAHRHTHTHTYSRFVLSGDSKPTPNPKPNTNHNPYNAPIVTRRRRQLICMSPVCIIYAATWYETCVHVHTQCCEVTGEHLVYYITLAPINFGASTHQRNEVPCILVFSLLLESSQDFPITSWHQLSTFSLEIDRM